MISTFSLQFIESRDNSQVKLWRRLARENLAYRKHGLLWLEGEHLCDMAKQAGLKARYLVVTDVLWHSGAAANWLPTQESSVVVVLPERLFCEISGLESPSGLAWVLDWSGARELLPLVPTIVFDRLQDAGNVGSILRSAAAFGFQQIIALKGTAGLYSPKVLRSAMGAHFSLRLVEQVDGAVLQKLQLPLFLTSSYAQRMLHTQPLDWPCAWVFGNEGQGIAEYLQVLPHTSIGIAQPGGQESLNVAAAAAICLHSSALSGISQVAK